MHYLGVVTEQITHEDPQLALARRQARQRRDAHRDAHRAARRPAGEKLAWWASLSRAEAQDGGGRRHVRLLGGHGIFAPH